MRQRAQAGEQLRGDLPLLAACSLYAPTPQLQEALARCDPARAYATAEAHQLIGATFDHLERMPERPGSGGRLMEMMAPVALVHRAHGLLLAGELRDCHTLFSAQGILAVPFKGPAFCVATGQRPQAREMGDLDFLVHPESIHRAAQAIQGAGFEAPLPDTALRSRWLSLANDELMLVRPSDGCAIELHWRLGQTWFPGHVSLRDIEARLESLDFFGTPVPTLCPEHLLLIHAADGLKSGGASLRWALDLITIVRRHQDIDWAELFAVAEASGGTLGLQAAFEVARRVYQAAARMTGASPSLPIPDCLASEAAALADTMCRRMSAGTRVAGAAQHFRWALRLSRRKLRTLTEVGTYLSRPGFADLARIPERGEGMLRMRAVARRVRAAFG